MIVRKVNVTDVYDLRRRVLRSNDPDASVEWECDLAESTVHFAVVDGDAIVGISTWITDTTGALQLRGMATDPEFLGRGVGTRLLHAGLALARTLGAPQVWANARVTALGFYEQSGFTATGPVFTTPATGLPHRLVTYPLA